MKEQRRQRPPGAPRRGGAACVDALAGVVAGALTLAVADLVAQVLDPASSPLLAVGGTVIDLTPGWLKDFAVSRFGTSDKLVLLLSMGLVVTALAAAAGLTVRRRPRVAALLVLALGLVAAAAAAARPGGGPLARRPVPGRRRRRAPRAALVRPDRPARRRCRFESVRPEPGDAAAGPAAVLVTVAGTAGAAALAGAAGRAVPVLTGHGQGPADVRLPAPSDAGVLDAAAASVAVDGVTPVRDARPGLLPHRHRPVRAAARRLDDWRLRLHGMVGPRARARLPRPARPCRSSSATITLTCVSNEVGRDARRQRAVAGSSRRRPARARPAYGPTPTWCCHELRRLHRLARRSPR